MVATKTFRPAYLHPAFWEANPMVLPFLAFGAGLVIADVGLLSWGAAVSLVLFGFLLVPFHRRSGAVAAATTLVWLGLGVWVAGHLGPTTQLPLTQTPLNAEVRGNVLGPVFSSERGYRFALQVTHIHRADGWAEADWLLWANLPANVAEAPEAGTAIQTQLELTALSDSIPFFQQLHREGIQGNARCATIQAKGPALGFWAAVERYRTMLSDRLRQWIPSPDQHALATALLLDDRAGMDAAIRDDFRASGLSHVLALSGMHVVFLMAFVGAALQILVGWVRRRWLAACLLALFLIGYTLITGAGPSVFRALLFALIGLAAPLLGRQVQPLNAVATAGLVQCLITPSDLFSLGFQLSYSAVIGILLFSPHLMRWLPVQWAPLRWMRDTLVVSFTAQLGVLPVTLAAFGTLPLYFLPANLAAGILGTWALAVAFLLVLLADVPFLAGPLGFVLDWLLYALRQVAQFFAGLPGAVIEGLAVPGWLAVLIGFGILTLGLSLKKPKQYEKDLPESIFF